MPGIHDSPRNFSGAVRTSVALRDRTLPAYPFRPSRLRRSSLIHTPCGSATEKNSSYSDATHTQEGPSGSCRRPRFFGRNRSLHVPCSRIIPNMPTRANRNRNPTNRPTAKKKARRASTVKPFHQSGGLDSNQRPHAPQTCTLTGLSYAPIPPPKPLAPVWDCKYKDNFQKNIFLSHFFLLLC